MKGCEFRWVKHWLANLKRLEIVDLRGNELCRLEPSWFAGMNRLKKIVLDQDQLTYLNGARVCGDDFEQLVREVSMSDDVEVLFMDYQSCLDLGEDEWFLYS